MNMAIDLDRTLRGSNSNTSSVYCHVSAAVCLFGCVSECVVEGGGGRGGDAGIVQFVTFSIDVSFFRRKINSA